MCTIKQCYPIEVEMSSGDSLYSLPTFLGRSTGSPNNHTQNEVLP